MASVTRIRNLVGVRHCGRYESKGVAANVDIRNRLFDFRHVASDTFTALTTCLVMRMLFDGAYARTVWGASAHGIRGK